MISTSGCMLIALHVQLHEIVTRILTSVIWTQDPRSKRCPSCQSCAVWPSLAFTFGVWWGCGTGVVNWDLGPTAPTSVSHALNLSTYLSVKCRTLGQMMVIARPLMCLLGFLVVLVNSILLCKKESVKFAAHFDPSVGVSTLPVDCVSSKPKYEGSAV